MVEGNGTAGKKIAEVILRTGGEFTGRTGDARLENAAAKELQAAMEMAGKDPAQQGARLGREGLLEGFSVGEEEMLVDPARTDRADGIVEKDGDGFFPGDFAEDGIDLVFGEEAVRALLRRDFSIDDKKLDLVPLSPGEPVMPAAPARPG